MAKYAVAIGVVLLVVGISMQAIPEVQSAGDVIVDTTPPRNKSTYPPPSTTRDSPSVLDYEQPKDKTLAGLVVQDDTSGIDMSTFHMKCINISEDRVLFNKSGAKSFDSKTGRDGTTDLALVTEWMRSYFSDTDGDGKLELPMGDKFKFEMSVRDMAGNKFDATGWYRVKVGAPGGDWYINGKGWSSVKYITSNSISFKFKATANPGLVSSAKVDIDTQGGTHVKEVALSEASADTYTGSTTLSDGKYTVKGIVNGNTLAQVNFPLNASTPDYGNWLAYGLMGTGLLSLLGGVWKLASLA